MIQPDTNQDWLEEQLANSNPDTNNNLKQLNGCLNIIIPSILFLCPAILAVGFGLKAGLLFGALFSGAMFINAVVSNLSNAFIGRELGGDFDLFWRLVFIMGFTLSLSLYFVV